MKCGPPGHEGWDAGLGRSVIPCPAPRSILTWLADPSRDHSPFHPWHALLCCPPSAPWPLEIGVWREMLGQLVSKLGEPGILAETWGLRCVRRRIKVENPPSLSGRLLFPLLVSHPLLHIPSLSPSLVFPLFPVSEPRGASAWNIVEF